MSFDFFRQHFFGKQSAASTYDHAASLATVNAMAAQVLPANAKLSEGAVGDAITRPMLADSIPPPTSIPAVQPATAPEEIPMSFLSTFGNDFKAVFAWIGSTKGQAVITSGEKLAEVIVPGATPVINLANSWMTQILTTQALAAAAEEQPGTGAQKAAAVIAAISPQVVSLFPAINSAQIAAANDSLVAFLNALGTATVPAPAATSATTEVAA